MSNNIILIPARSGSERVKGKNLRLLGGKPLITHSIESAIESNAGEVYVSTDSSEYKNIAESYGAKVPFLRPKYLSTSNAKSSWVIIHFLKWLNKNKKDFPKNIVFCPPTNPFLKHNTIQKMIIKINKNNSYNSIITYAKPKTHPFRIIKVENSGSVKNDVIKIDGKTINNYERSQDFPLLFEGSPACRITKTAFFVDKFLSEKNVKNISYNKTYDYKKVMGYKITQKEAFDIDTEDDFKLAEILI